MTDNCPESQQGKPTPGGVYTDFETNRYPWWKCAWEGTYLAFSLALWAKLVISTVAQHSEPLSTLIGFIAAQFIVDFISGIVHWGGDTWGTFKTPIFGSTVIGPFRMHHVDPQDITAHGFMQTNAASCYPMPFFIIACLMYCSGSFASQTCNWMIIFGVPVGIITNQCHKWAHEVHSRPHPLVGFFQKTGLIISHERHHKHHQGNFDSNYCIINGWMNPILDYINFWRVVENIITKLTGTVPRQDDAYWRGVAAEQKKKLSA